MSPIGHFAAGFIAKKFAPKIHISILFIASWFIDVMYFVYVIFGIEKFDATGQTPAAWSHSLLMAIVYSIIVFIIIKLIYKDNHSAMVVGMVVFSHWVLDIVVWSSLPFAPLFLGHLPYVKGMGLYNSTDNIGKSIIDFSILIPSVIFYIYTKKQLSKR